jgi:hypothetical protein
MVPREVSRVANSGQGEAAEQPTAEEALRPGNDYTRRERQEGWPS